MRQTLLAVAAAFMIGGITTGAVLSYAQPAPPPSGPMAGGQPGHPRMGGWWHHPRPGWMHHGGEQRPFALIFRAPDRGLSPADVQKIAEGFLLWNGNHTWKVTNVAAAANGPIGFDLASPDGSVIAKFTMDPHTGKIERAG